MYGAIRDLFCDALGYPRPAVVIDTAGEGGRPDITVRAPSGVSDTSGVDLLIDWIVVEAKDERDAFTSPANREDIFAKKAKYIGPDTAWFVMIDPTIIVARPVHSADVDKMNDICCPLDGSETETVFKQTFARLSSDLAGVPSRLLSFRAGDVTQIATEKLIAPDDANRRRQNQVLLARRNFYSTLTRTTQYLQETTLTALRGILPTIQEVEARVGIFGEKYGGYVFRPYPLSIRGNPRNLTETRTHDREASKLRRYLAQHGTIARLALEGLPEFKARTGAQDQKVHAMFAAETANLVLARILLIRFLEDHSFFGEQKFVCNGGVQAFQNMKTYFHLGYTTLLEDAYKRAGRLYSAAFDETELDWIFAIDDNHLSAAIEWAMYQLSRYDFRTVKGDILTGIYDRFLDRKQRKEYGEYYTPPSIARYIIDRLNIRPEERILDPSCGSGTFLIEAYQRSVGEDAERGVATYKDAIAVLDRLAGNDLNTFSAVLAQIQLLWHLLIFRDDITREGFPEIVITDKANSLVRTQLEAGSHTRFSEIDQREYNAVIGNPPYVRPERSGELDAFTAGYFETPRSKPNGEEAWSGISPESNIYNLFLFRALDSWCKQPDARGRGAGKLGFIVPLSFCDSNESADLRALFGPNGRWTIRELVDLEVIYKQIFDADVLPVIILAEARQPFLPLKDEWLNREHPLHSDPITRARIGAARLHIWMKKRRDAARTRSDAKREKGWCDLMKRGESRWQPDKVTIRIADKSCLEFHDGEKRPHFRLQDLPEREIAYSDVFTADGRILTRLTPDRQSVLRKIQAHKTLADVLKRYWVKRSGHSLSEWTLKRPKVHEKGWTEREMISRGIVYAGRKKSALPGKGLDVYKAENIIATGLVGEPQDENIDVEAARNQYLWTFKDILPRKMFAVARIATCPNAVAFDPHKIAFTDTATIFAPEDALRDFPFDLLFLSRIIRFTYAVSLRMSALNNYRSCAYPTNVRQLPWSDALLACTKDIESLRASISNACAAAFTTDVALHKELSALSLKSLRDVVRSTPGVKLTWSDSLTSGETNIGILSHTVAKSEDGWRLQLSEYLYDWVECTSEPIARQLAIALQAHAGKEMDRAELLGLRIPPNPEVLKEFKDTLMKYSTTDHLSAVEDEIDNLDSIIAPCFGLAKADLKFIRDEMSEDPFLKNIKPRYPSTTTRIHGYRTGLDLATRYD